MSQSEFTFDKVDEDDDNGCSKFLDELTKALFFFLNYFTINFLISLSSNF